MCPLIKWKTEPSVRQDPAMRPRGATHLRGKQEGGWAEYCGVCVLRPLWRHCIIGPAGGVQVSYSVVLMRPAKWQEIIMTMEANPEAQIRLGLSRR